MVTIHKVGMDLILQDGQVVAMGDVDADNVLDLVVGAGKAAASMALAVEKNWPGELSGLVVTRYGHTPPRPEGLPARTISSAGKTKAERLEGS